MKIPRPAQFGLTLRRLLSIRPRDSLSLSVVGLVLAFPLAFPVLSAAGTLDGADSAAAGSIGIGSDARAAGAGAVAIGSNAFAEGDSSTSVGSTSNANSLQSTALGASALADQTQASALGSFAQALGEFTTAVGGNAFVEGQGGTALGVNAVVEATEGTALGLEAYVIEGATGSVALGSGSQVSTAHTVSVGNADTGQTRRITQVAAGIQPLDVVNVGQFHQGIQGVREDAFAGIAAAAAFTPARPSAPGKTAISLGAAGYRGEQAVSISVSHRLLDSRYNMQLDGGVAYDSSEHAVGRVGVSWEF